MRLSPLCLLSVAWLACGGADDDMSSLSHARPSGEVRDLDAALALDAALDAAAEQPEVIDASVGEDASACTGLCVFGDIDTETRACGSAGLQTYVRTCSLTCDWGAFQLAGSCIETAPTCTPGALETLSTVACGMCGSASITRSCNAEGSWEPPAKTACASEGVCKPGATKNASVSCGMCGEATTTQTCNAQCAWEPVKTGSCAGQGTCKPGATRSVEGAACGPCSKGTTQTKQTCSNGCAWTNTSSSCALPSNVCKPEGYEGSTGWHCVGANKREWCYVETAAASLRCTWTGGSETYSGC